MTHSPWSVTWYLTKICNLTCSHCFVYEGEEMPKKKSTDLTFEQSKDIVEKLADDGVFQICFAGGEPLALKWFDDLIAHCTSVGIQTMCSTNGTYLDLKRAKALKLNGLSVVQLSFDGAFAETHDAIRGQRQFSDLMKAVDACQIAALDLQIAMVITKHNLYEVAALFDLCKSIHIDKVRINGYIPTGRSQGDLDAIPPKKEFREALLLAKNLGEMNHIAVDFPCFMGHLDAKPEDHDSTRRADKLSCGAATTRGVLFEDGSLGVCEFMREDVVGNLKDSSIENLWADDSNITLSKWRALEKISGSCGSCTLQSNCGYGCRANAYYSGGDFYGWDPLCISKPENDEFKLKTNKLTIPINKIQ
jgi:radical SAM protein with 4Fe4S-binding SPASM domain